MKRPGHSSIYKKNICYLLFEIYSRLEKFAGLVVFAEIISVEAGKTP
ncbi:hypothetical protein HMPREF1249_0021 [Jonquetella sp. BV3C21]|nr:hypothetical protein GCWU000246_01221 [Jonquetella anthropi E3_33 E1]ERL23840.1 hypothetical protein HMPREF1249_0021 [Jonquetella sp. BV3C21]